MMTQRYRHRAHATALVLLAAFAQGASAGITLPDKGASAEVTLPDAGLARVHPNAQAGTIVAYAGSPGGIVSDGRDGARNSPYAQALLRYLEAPLDVGLMLRWVRDAVLDLTSGEQEPVAHVSLSGRSVYLTANPASHPSPRKQAGGAEREEASPRVALTIGNGAYQHASVLKNPLNDAEAVSSALEGLGFEVVRLADVDGAALDSGLVQFREKAADAEIAVVYYSGHGIQIAGSHYLLPVDVPFGSPGEIDAVAVPLDRVMHAVEPASVLRLIMLDAMFEAQRNGDVR